MSSVQYLRRPEGRVAYTIEGPADGRLVVLVPGMGDLRSTWRELVGPLATAGYRVVTTDLRGHGDSDLTFRRFGDEQTAGDILALVDELGGGPAVLVGNSMGAAAAAWAAAERPDAVTALVLSGPLLRNPPGQRVMATLTRLAFPLLFARPWGARLWSTYYRNTLNRGRQAPWLDEHVAALRAAYRVPARLAQFRRLTWQLTHEDVERRLPDVQAPVLAFVGQRDPDYRDPAAEAAWIEGSVEGRVVLLDEVAHYPHHQAPDVVVPALLDFLATLPRLPRPAVGR